MKISDKLSAFHLTLSDNEAPEFVNLLDIDSFTDAGSCQAVVSFNVTATGNCNESLAVTCNPASGSAFDIGVTRVNCSATDQSGNVMEDYFTVNVTGR